MRSQVSRSGLRETSKERSISKPLQNKLLRSSGNGQTRGGEMKFARALAASLLCVVAASGAAAQTYPNRPVTIVVAFAPGGADEPRSPARSPPSSTRTRRPPTTPRTPTASRSAAPDPPHKQGKRHTRRRHRCNSAWHDVHTDCSAWATECSPSTDSRCTAAGNRRRQGRRYSRRHREKSGRRVRRCRPAACPLEPTEPR